MSAQVKSKKQRRIGINDTNLFWHVLAFVCPVVILIIAFIQKGISPFGNESMLSMDLWSQYFPMIAEQHANRRAFISSGFSWNGALGINAFAQNSYYCNSLFNWLLVPFSREHLIDALDWLILAKFGLSALSMSFYLKYKFKKINFPVVACSVCYSLCAYSLAFSNQVMWFDAIIYFPIIILGFERLVIEKKPILYCVSLAICIYSCFYISFCVCLFLVVYFFYFLIINTKELDRKSIIQTSVRFGVYSLIGGLSVAFVILPIYKQISLTLASDIPAPTKLELYNSFFDYVLKLLPKTPVSLEYGIPNIYSGSIIFMLLPTYFLSKKIDIKEKFFSVLLIFFLFFSMNLNVLDYIWHGFHFPNQLPGRWTFIFSFILLTLCAKVFTEYKEIAIPKIVISGAISVILFGISYLLAKEETSFESIITAYIFIAIYIILFILVALFKEDKFQKTMVAMLSVAIILEVGFNGVYTFVTHTDTGNIGKYTQFDEAMNSFDEQYSADSTEFYRTDIYENWTFNSPLLYGIKGPTYYSSTMSGNAYNFFKNLGMRVYAKNVSSIYVPYSPVTNSLFGIKYIANRNMIAFPSGISTIGKCGDNITVVENSYCLPVAFVANDNVLSWKYSARDSFIKNQDTLFSAVTGTDKNVFNQIKWDKETNLNASVHKSSDWSQSTYSCPDKSTCLFSFEYTVQTDGDFYLANNFKRGQLVIKINQTEYKPNIDRVPHIALGQLQKGDVISVKVTVTGVGVGYFGMELYSLDSELFAKEVKKLKSNGLIVDNVNGDKITGTITSDGGTIFTSIAKENNGFDVYVDGEKVETQLIADYLLSFNVPSGTHEIVFDYDVPGLKLGIAISSVFIVLFVLLTIIDKKKKQNGGDK